METTQQYIHEIATILPQSTNGNHTEGSISYEEYKALESGFLEEKRKLEDRMWLDSNMSQFDEILRQNYDSSLRKFSEKVITYIAKVTGAVYGAFFTVNHDSQRVNATGGYACTVETMDRTSFNLGEGLVGQVAKSKELLCLDNVETQLDSSLGRISACFLAISPLVFNDRVYGIVELTMLSKLKPRYVTLLERMSRSVAAVLQSIINNQSTKELLIESLQQSEEFKSQQEELRKRDEALQLLREQLQRKELELQGLIGNFESNETGISAEIFSKLNTELLDAQTALAHIRMEWQQQQTEIATLTDSQTTHIAHQDVLKRQEKQIQDLTDSLHWKQEEVERQSHVLQERKQELEKLQNEVGDRENESKRFLEEIIRQEKSLQQKEQMLASLHTQLQDTIANTQVPAEISHLQNVLQQKETLQQQLQQALELEHINYVEQLESMKVASQEIENKGTALENLEQQWHIQTQIWQAWQQTAQQRELELQTLQAESADKNTLLASLQNDYNQKNELTQQLEAQYTQLQADYETQQIILTAFKEEVTQKDGFLQGLKEELRQYEADTQRQQRDMQELQTRLSKKEDELLVTQYMLNQLQANPLATRENERLNKELEEKEATLRTFKTNAPQITSDSQASELASRIAEQHESMEQMQEEIKRYTEAFESVNKSFEDASEDLENIKQYATLKENEVEHLQKQLKEAEVQAAEAPEISHLVAELREKEALATELAGKLEAYSSPDNYIQTQYSNIQQKIKDLETVQQHLADREIEVNYLQESIEAQKQQTKQNDGEHSKNQDELMQLRIQIELKQVEMHRRELELAELFNKINTAFAMLEIDMQGKILSVNNKLLFHLGLSEEEMLYQPYTKFLKPQFVASNEYKQLWHELEKVGVTQVVDDLIMVGRKDREMKMNVTLIPILDAAGKPYEIIKLVNFLVTEAEENKQLIYSGDYSHLADTTHKVGNISTESIVQIAPLPAETEVMDFDEEREIFKAIQNSFMLLELDVYGRIITANHQIARCLGYDEAELVGKLHAELLHEDEQDSEAYQDILAHLSDGHYATEVITYIGKEKEKIVLRSYFNPLKDTEDKTRKILVMSQYIH